MVGPRSGAGRELLRSLTAAGVPWCGFEATTPLRLAHDLIATDLALAGTLVIDEFDELALLDAAMDAVLTGSRGTLARLAEGSGLRRAVASSIRALRQSGVTAADLQAVRFRDEEKRRQLERILGEFEQRLDAGSQIDAAGLFARAVGRLEGDASGALGDRRIYLLPDQGACGLAGRFLELLMQLGAVVLPADPVFGLVRPEGLLAAARTDPAAAHAAGASPLAWLHDPAGWQAVAARPVAAGTDAGAADRSAGDVVLDLFAATSVVAELREVLRRCIAAGLHWDEVEIIASDPVAYGVALDGLGRRLGVPVTFAAGLPLVRTRPGRAVSAYLQWIRQGVPVAGMRRMLERGDLVPERAAYSPSGGPGAGGVAHGGVSGVGLARRLRRLRIGRGWAGWEAALERLERRPGEAGAEPAGPEDDRPPSDRLADEERQRLEDAVLADLLRHLLDATPAAGSANPVSASGVAAGALALLERVPLTTPADRAAAGRLRTRLARIHATLRRPTSLAAACSMIEAELDGRTGPDATAAAGGHLHLSDFDRGGLTGRRATFVVGLDAARFPGPVGSDALLVDEDRRRLGDAVAATPGRAVPTLRTEAERTADRRHVLAALVARLRGRVTFSYARWDAVEGRSLAPASELLQVYRLVSGDPTADYEALHAAVEPAASPVPRGAGLLDADDVWLHTLAHDPGSAESGLAGGALRRGVAAVCAVYPGLAGGADAWRQRRRSRVPTAHHGLIAPRPRLDPRRNDSLVVSAQQLQTLGACPHRYLLEYVLGARPPRDADTAPDQWLGTLERGTLLHAVFERSLRSAADNGISPDSDAFARRALDILEDEMAAMRERVQPPGESVFGAEREHLRDDVRAFVAMVREDAGRRPGLALELEFGRSGADPVAIDLPDGAVVRLAGAIDRVDELDDGSVVIVDYKTGSNLRFGGRNGPFDGGRRLQHVLYAAAAERLLGRAISRAEFQFPSRRSENYRARFGPQHLRDGLGVVTELLGLLERGWFVPTNDTEDCRHCAFGPVCRTSVDGYGKVSSQPAEWSRESEGEAADLLRNLRR